MRSIFAVILTMLFVWNASALGDGGYTTVAELYNYITENIYPEMPSRACGPLLRSLLVKLEVLDPGERPFSLKRFDDWELRRSLYKAGCVSRHFKIWVTPPPAIKRDCDIGSFTRVAGILRIYFRREDNYNDPEDICAFVGGILANAVEKVRWGDLKVYGNEPYILDLQNNRGGRGRLVLEKYFAPYQYADMYTRKFRVSGKKWFGASESSQTFVARSAGVFHCPRAILVDNETASAGEIIAEVVRGWCPGSPVMGQLTYGKGAGTTWHNIGRFTVAVPENRYYFGKDQHTIDGQGVVPDIFLSERTREGRLSAAMDYARCNAPGVFRH